MSPNKAAFIYSDKLSQHILSTSHPMQPKRLAMTYDLLKQYNQSKKMMSNIGGNRRKQQKMMKQFGKGDLKL